MATYRNFSILEDEEPTREEQEADAWEYWHQRACRFEKALHLIAFGYLGDKTAEEQFVWAQDTARHALTSINRADHEHL